MSETEARVLFALNLDDYMRDRGVSRADVCKATGIPYTTLANWLQAKRYPRPEHVTKLAKYLGVSVADLVDEQYEGGVLRESQDSAQTHPPPDNILPMPATYTVPLLGAIACGEPILAAENIEDNVEVPEHLHADFALRCKGDSMINARIHDGDIVYIRQQPAVNNGEIAAVLIGDEATLKRVYVYEDHVVLQPENPAYEPLVYFKDAMQAVRILGKAVGFTSLLP